MPKDTSERADIQDISSAIGIIIMLLVIGFIVGFATGYASAVKNTHIEAVEAEVGEWHVDKDANTSFFWRTNK